MPIFNGGHKYRLYLSWQLEQNEIHWVERYVQTTPDVSPRSFFFLISKKCFFELVFIIIFFPFLVALVAAAAPWSLVVLPVFLVNNVWHGSGAVWEAGPPIYKKKRKTHAQRKVKEIFQKEKRLRQTISRSSGETWWFFFCVLSIFIKEGGLK